MSRHAPFEPIDPNSCVWGGVPDVINCANFFESRSRGLGAGIPRKTAFPIESVHGPYNSVSTTVLHCDAKERGSGTYGIPCRYEFDVFLRRMVCTLQTLYFSVTKLGQLQRNARGMMLAYELPSIISTFVVTCFCVFDLGKNIYVYCKSKQVRHCRGPGREETEPTQL